jgi:hypothetical protein
LQRDGTAPFVVADVWADVLSHVWNLTASVQEWLVLVPEVSPSTVHVVVPSGMDGAQVPPVPGVPVRT